MSIVQSSDVFYSDPSQGTWQDIAERTGSDCVEMESFALFHNASNIPMPASHLIATPSIGSVTTAALISSVHLTHQQPLLLRLKRSIFCKRSLNAKKISGTLPITHLANSKRPVSRLVTQKVLSSRSMCVMPLRLSKLLSWHSIRGCLSTLLFHQHVHRKTHSSVWRSWQLILKNKLTVA